MRQIRIWITTSLLGALLALPSASLGQVNVEVALRAAMETETVEGDLSAAIEQYGKLAGSSNRAVAARALIRMAGCYEKLGVAKARTTYERVVKEFSDQAESVATAHARLEALRSPAVSESGLSLRQVWNGPWVNGTVSSDGRFVSFTDWSTCSTGSSAPCRGDLGVRDLVAGTNRLLTDLENAPGSWIDASAISPDGSQVGYVWVDTSDWHWVVQIVPINGGAPPRTLYRSPKTFWVKQWTRDGQNLLITRMLDDETWQIALLSVQDGSLREIKTLRWGGIGTSISPDGRYVAYDTPAGEGPARDIFVIAVEGSQEVPVVQHPANDHSTVWSQDGSRILFVSDRTTKPSLWSVPVREGKPVGEAELLKSDIGEIQPLGMTGKGALYYTVTGGIRNVYRAALGADGKVFGPPVAVTDRFMNSNWGATVSPDGENVAYYSNRPETVLVVQNLQSGQERVVQLGLQIDSLYHSGPGWLPDSRALLVSVRENQRPGSFLYCVDLATGDVKEVAHGARAFKESPDGKSVFFAQGNSTRLVRLDLDTGRETVVRAVNRHIHNPAISPDGKKLAYMHESEDETLLAVMPLTGGEPRVILRESRWNGGARYNTLEWTPDQRYLLYVREEGTGDSIWRVPAAGGEAVRVGVTMKGSIKAPQMHPDGKSIFFTTVESRSAEVWVLENFLPDQAASK
jgi:Tol biopolymer transport system component